jgi:hypothetical protein
MISQNPEKFYKFFHLLKTSYILTRRDRDSIMSLVGITMGGCLPPGIGAVGYDV